MQGEGYVARIGDLILLGGGTEAVPIIQRARELGHRAVVVDGDISCAMRDMADTFVHVSCYHGDQAIAVLRASGLHFDGVLCCAVDAPVAAAEVAAAFELPGLSVEAARLSSYKYEQKLALQSVGIPVPFFSHPHDDGTWDIPVSRGVVLKPNDSRGGRGVVRVLPGVALQLAYDTAVQYSPAKSVIAEEWLDGPQLSTESIVQDGRVLFTAAGLRNYSRLDEFAPFVTEDGFNEPFVNPFWPERDLYYEISKTIQDACRALGWYQQGAGTVKGDLVIHDGRVYVIELAARLSGGFFATHGHVLAYGVDFVGAAIQAALGCTLDEPKPHVRQFVSQRYVFPTPEDIGKTIVGLPDVSRLDGFCTWGWRAGRIVEAVTCHPSRWGQAMATGHTPDEAREKADALVREMRSGVVLQ